MRKLYFVSILIVLTLLCNVQSMFAQEEEVNDATTPLHLMQPQYDYPYGIPQKESITEVLGRIHQYLDNTTPARLIDMETKKEVTDFKKLDKVKYLAFDRGDFRLISYEWGVTYAGMLLAGEATGDSKFSSYTTERLQFLAELYPELVNRGNGRARMGNPMHSVIYPSALDDAGAICAAMIKTKQNGSKADLDPMINNFIDYISNEQMRLSDGTLARNRPMKNALWLDDLFMSVPALAQMGAYTGQQKYFDDATKQIIQFSDRMFVKEKGLFMHAYIEDMQDHPEFFWGRANGWAIMSMVELLEVLPTSHQNYDKILDLLQQHIAGLAKLQSAKGLWHQLLDRNDTYLETSATAIFTYAIARAINKGYVDAKVYGPMVCLAWNALAEQVNPKGQVEGTCVGTGMGFDPAFYAYRPVSVYAAHGYGPVLLAGAEMISLLENTHPKMNDSAIQFYDMPIKSNRPIFSVDE